MEASPEAPEVGALPAGTVLEASERRVVDGVLRLRLKADTRRGREGGWVSEYRSVAFDPRLGGHVQLMRLFGPPLGKRWQGLHPYTFAS